MPAGVQGLRDGGKGGGSMGCALARLAREDLKPDGGDCRLLGPLSKLMGVDMAAHVAWETNEATATWWTVKRSIWCVAAQEISWHWSAMAQFRGAGGLSERALQVAEPLVHTDP